jgi:radical SAM superfamily enzyme YgiQ (UPF0313 family)
MDKQQQIEEMVQSVCDCYLPALGVCCLDNKPCDRRCSFGSSALLFYNAGYRKIPEGSVVLSKEEYEQLCKGVKGYTAMFIAGDLDQIHDLENRFKEARKETAKEVLEKISNTPIELTDLDPNTVGIMMATLIDRKNVIAKEFGVEL